jgi:hypothetical protein
MYVVKMFWLKLSNWLERACREMGLTGGLCSAHGRKAEVGAVKVAEPVWKPEAEPEPALLEPEPALLEPEPALLEPEPEPKFEAAPQLLQTLSRRFYDTLMRLENHQLFPCDGQVDNVAFDPFDVCVGACRLAEAVIPANANINQFWIRTAAVACLTISMKHAKACSIDRLKRFVSIGNGTTALYFCVFVKFEKCHTSEMDNYALYNGIRNAELKILSKLQTSLFSLLVLTPAMSVELLLDSLINESDLKMSLCCLVRNVSACLCLCLHFNHIESTELVRRCHLVETSTVVSRALLLIAIEAIATTHKEAMLPYELVVFCLKSESSAVQLALRVVDAALNADFIPEARIRRFHDRRTFELVSVNTLFRVRASLINIINKI